MKNKYRKTNGLSKLLIVLLSVGIIAIASLLLLSPSLTFFSISSSDNDSDSGNIIETGKKSVADDEVLAALESPEANLEAPADETQETSTAPETSQETDELIEKPVRKPKKNPKTDIKSSKSSGGIIVSSSKTPAEQVGVQFSGSGSGTSGDPYQITSWAQLDEIHDNLAANYILMNDLNSSTSGYAGIGSDWEPIGSWDGPFIPFNGSFNGNNYTISDIVINKPLVSTVGFFAVAENASIYDLGLVNIDVTGKEFVGGFIGWLSWGTVIHHCYVTGTVSEVGAASGYVGGFMGTMDEEYPGVYIDNSYFIGEVSGSTDVGGFAGSVDYGGKVYRSYAIANVTGLDEGYDCSVGGFTGEMMGSVGLGLIPVLQDVYSGGNVVGLGTEHIWAGGIVGHLVEGKIINAYSTADVDGVEDVGGLIGLSGYESVSNSYSVGSVSGSTNVGGFLGYNVTGHPTTLSNNGWWTGAGPSYAVGNTAGSITYNEADKTVFYSKTHGVYAAGSSTWDFLGVWLERNNDYPVLRWQVCPFSGSGAGTAGNPYQITSWTQLDQVRCDLTADYILMNDLGTGDSDYAEFNSGTGWIPIGDCGPADECWYSNHDYTFQGSFDGNGSTIAGLYSHPSGDYPADSYVGLFGAVHGGTISHLGLIDVDLEGDADSWDFGAIAGAFGLGSSSANSIMYNCYSNGTISGHDSVGGLVGYLESTGETSISESYSTASVDADNSAGGIAGASWAIVSNVYAAGSITGSSNIGGLIGYSEGTETDCGWWTGAGPSYGIGGGPARDLTYNESLKSAFYSASHPIYSTWDFADVWAEQETDFPIFGEGEEEPPWYPPNVTGFPVGSGSTNFSDVANLTIVANLTLANENGTIKFNDTHLVDARNENYDLHVKIGEGFVSVNTTGLNPTFNSSTSITLNDVDCPAVVYYGNAQSYTNKQQIIAEGHICSATSNPSCIDAYCNYTARTLTFTASHFTGYAAGPNAELSIWDSNDTEGGGKIINAFENAAFYANYTNLTSGASINGTNIFCQIKFRILSNWTQSYNMTFNTTSSLYEYNKAFSNYGTYTWNVSCIGSYLGEGYSNLQANDTVVINGTAPEIPGGAGQGETGGSSGGPGSGTVNATLPNVVAINLTVDTVDFGDMTPGEQKANLSGIRIQNDGTLRVNIDIGGTDLWTAPHTFPGDNYLFKIAEAGEGGPEAGTFDSASLMSWTQMSTASALSIFNLNILDAHDIVAIHVNVTVPLGEPAGLKTSTLTLTAYSV